MKERRNMRRFDLELPCLIGAFGTDDEYVKLMTNNISAGGAYINGDKAFPVGTRLKIQILISRPGRSCEAQAGVCVNLCCEVIRTDASGMAVEFDDQYRISQIQKMLNNDDLPNGMDGGYQALRSHSVGLA